MTNNIIYKKVGEWEKKGSRKSLNIKITKWLEQFDGDEKIEMLALLEHFDYYSLNKIPEIVKELYSKFRQICESEDVVFTKTEKEIGTSFSNLFFMSFWQHNDLYDYTQDNLSKILNREDLPTHIVFIDDYFGTGKTFTKYLETLLSNNSTIKERKIYFIAQQGSYVGKKKIEEFAEINRLQLTLIVNKYSHKAFEYGYIYDASSADAHRKKYEEIYDKRTANANYKFGYKQIEALVSFYYNTPNNTLGLFWQNLCGFHALFERHQKKTTKLSNMKKNVKQHAELKSCKPFIRDVETYKLDLFIVYCIAKGTAFDVFEACRDFGLTDEQLNSMLSYLLDHNYIQCTNGKYEPTEALKKYLYTSRLKEFKQIYQNDPKLIDTRINDVSYVPRNFKDKFKGYN